MSTIFSLLLLTFFLLMTTNVRALPRRGHQEVEVEVVLEPRHQLPWTPSVYDSIDERSPLIRGRLFVDDFVPDDFKFYPRPEPLIAYETARIRRTRSVGTIPNEDENLDTNPNENETLDTIPNELSNFDVSPSEEEAKGGEKDAKMSKNVGIFANVAKKLAKDVSGLTEGRESRNLSSSRPWRQLLRRLADQTSAWLMSDASDVRAAQMRLARDVDSNSDDDDDSLDLDVLRKKIEQLSNRPEFDRELLQSLNETLHDASLGTDNAKVVKLFLRLVDEFESKEKKRVDSQTSTNDTSTEESGEISSESNERSGNESKSNGDNICGRIDKLKIMPGDDEQTVHHKQANLMKCYMDERQSPCTDFYAYACGRWEQHQPLPKDRGSYDVFEILREDLSSNLRKIFEDDNDQDSSTNDAVKLLFRSCMDLEKISERGKQPLLRLLRDKLGGWPVLLSDQEASEVSSKFSWLEAIRTLRMFNNDILIAVWVGPDGKDSKKFILQFDQSDLLLPSAEYYKLGLGHPIMRTYKQLLVDVAKMLGSEAGEERIDHEMTQVLKFETKLASIMMAPHERRNFSEIYTKLSLAELQRLVPGLELQKFLAPPLLPRVLNASEPVVMYALPYFQKLIEVLEHEDKRTLANYIIWRFVRHRINNLDSKFQRVQNKLYRTLFGREETPPRWKFCVSYVNGNMGNAVGAMFVRKHFDQQSKKDMELLTNEVQDVFSELVEEADWLSNSTKHLATEKIAAIIHNIGYPDHILDEQTLIDEIDGVEYSADEFFENVLKNLESRTQREMSQLDKSVNRSLWTATPAVVNAYYSRNRNQIMFPAGILQPPFYHKHFPKALNYGGIGVVIGHELTHGFDDKGRQFDHQGNIKQWWDHNSSASFRERKQCIIDQYSDFVVDEVNIRINGANTQGENIADNGGIKQAFEAYRRWLQQSNLIEERLPNLNHLSGEQLFFLNFAQVWCGSTRPEALRSKLRTAVHAPGKYRVLGSLSNLDAFAQAFNCPVGSPMNPERKCSVW